MQSAQLPENEDLRVQKLNDYKILDTKPEAQFDRITRIVAETIGVPIALVSLVDQDRQWFKSKYGIDADETPREVAFCAHAILDDALFVVPDATKDPRFADNPLVAGAPDIRFYAGAPLKLPDGLNLGTLCAIDTKPRNLTKRQEQLLTDLADIVVDEMELRIALEKAVDHAARESENSKLKDEFISVVSHELRTPLTSISGSLGLVASGAMGELPDNVKELISIAHRNSARLALLINDILDIEKLIAGKMQFDMQSQELSPLVEQAIRDNETYGVERRVKLKLGETGGKPEVRVDGARLLQVLCNLISNAVKYSPEDGTVAISVEPRGTLVRVTITDQGPGVPKEFHSQIFEKFAQADSSDTRKVGGTGLGLAISREIIVRMGGQIDFESEEDKGASFFFDLPLCKKESIDDKASADMSTAEGGPRLLVVEDDQDAAHLLRLSLARAGYTVDVADTGARAFKALRQNAYDLVTLDLDLPDICGLELMRQLRQQPEYAELPIIVISAKIEKGQLAINGDLANIDWLPKPVDEKRLLSAVESHLHPANPNGLRILHVEDDVDLHRIVAAGLGGKFEIQLATTLADARAVLSEADFDMVILDITLPDGSGWELLPEIRGRQPESRIIVLSGSEVTPNETKLVEAAFLKSKSSPDELFDAIRTRVNPGHAAGNPQ